MDTLTMNTILYTKIYAGKIVSNGNRLGQFDIWSPLRIFLIHNNNVVANNIQIWDFVELLST